MQNELESFIRACDAFVHALARRNGSNAILAQALNNGRKARGLSHVQLGQIAGLGAEYVRKLLNNAQRMKPMDARKLCKALTK